jgi:hypothetical protein
VREPRSTPEYTSGQPCIDLIVGEFDSLQIAVKTWMLVGRGLSEVEDELIDPAHLSTDEKAALWAGVVDAAARPSARRGRTHIVQLSRAHAA